MTISSCHMFPCWTRVNSNETRLSQKKDFFVFELDFELGFHFSAESEKNHFFIFSFFGCFHFIFI